MDKEQEWSTLMEAFPKFIFHSIPYGISNMVEMEQQMAMWEQGVKPRGLLSPFVPHQHPGGSQL
eukprot:5400940-Heterocapsa_arctica.AAC.1